MTAPVQTWIFRIAVNKTRDYRDRRQAAKRGGGQTPVSLQAEDPETGLTLDVPSAALGPEATLLKVEEAQLLDKALNRLDEPCREVIQLRYFADLSYDEISQALGLNIKTVSSRLSKCLDRLEEIARRVFAEGKPAASPSKK